MAGLRAPLAAQLVERCGGRIPPRQPRWELSLSSALPGGVQGDIWWVQSPIRDRIAQRIILGQIERLPSRRWIATTDDGRPVGDTFGSRKDAVEALASTLGCDIPFVDPRSLWDGRKA
jgi:hypothetical protein